MHAATGDVVRTGYLVSQYPAISHEFVAREVRALRAEGVQVRTFSVRPASPEHLRTAADHAERASTDVLLASKPALVAATAWLVARAPHAWLAGLRVALRSGPRTPRARLWQLFYLVEAVLLVRRMHGAGLRHVHVHFANNSADIARIAVAIGTALDGEAWSWSLAMHGPTEFDDVEGHDLANKVRSARLVACISEYCRQRLRELVEPRHHAKLQVVRMSVDPHRYTSHIEARATCSPAPLRVLFVGRLVPEKAPEVLLDAIAALPPGTVEARFVGGGPLASALAVRIAGGLADRVTLTGPLGQDELPAQYAWADVFCLPSYAEGLPVVLMEAMSTGLPVVTTRIAGIPELVEDGVCGVVVEPGRPDLVASALARLAADPELRIRLGRAALEAVRTAHDPGTNAVARLDVLAAEGVTPVAVPEVQVADTVPSR